jgi:flagellin-like protein
MLKRIFKQKRYFKNIYKSQKGITGLETAIILIAFVVVAAVFAYTVLSAGLFSTQKAQEAVYNGLAETQSTLEVKGAVLSQADPKDSDSMDAVATWAAGADGTVTQETTIVHQGTGSVLVTGDGAIAADGLLARTAAATITASEHDTVTFWARFGSAGLGGDLGFAAAAAAVGLVDASVSQVDISGNDTEWHVYSMTIHTAGANQSLYVGVYAIAADFAANTIYIDDVQVNNVSLWTSSLFQQYHSDAGPGHRWNGC